MINLPGPDTTDWGTLYNNAINQLETMINNSDNSISGLITLLNQFQTALQETQNTFNEPITPGTKSRITFDANGFVTDGEDLNTQFVDHNGTPLSEVIQTLQNTFNSPIAPGTKTKITYDANGLVTGGSSLIANDIPELPISRISGLSEIVNLVLVDMGKVSISARIINTNGGIRVSCFTNPNVPVQTWRVVMEWKGSIFYEVYSSASETFINMGNFTEIPDNEALDITVEAISGSSINGNRYSHTYKYIPTSIDLRVTDVEKNLDPVKIIDRLVQDENAITEIANILQHSNTLIRKLDEYMNR